MTASPGLRFSLGAEIEMPVIDDAGRSACVGSGYFDALLHARAASGDGVQAETLPGKMRPDAAQPDDTAPIVVAVKCSTVTGGAVIGGAVVNGLDNGFNLLESAHAPEPAGDGGLRRLAARLRDDLARVQAALAPEGLAITALSQHPTAGTAPDWYRRAVAPRPIYRYLTRVRGWDHAVGIDAKAQNGPTTGTSVPACIDALNLLLAASPAFIALFAGSPWEDGRPTGLHETRMTLWPRMVAPSRVAADRDRAGLPPRWFTSLADYFGWTFGPGSVMHAVPAAGDGYKSAPGFVVAGDGGLNALDFLAGQPVGATRVDSGERTRLTPDTSHFEALQWSNFLDIRVRFGFGPDRPAAADLARALRDPAATDALLGASLNNLYLENRCAGATFADADLAARASGAVCASAMIAPLALQAGLVAAAPAQAAAFLRRWPMETVQALRAEAIRHALTPATDPRLRRLCDEVLALASDHLPDADRCTLAYAHWVAQTGLSTSARALAQLGSTGAGTEALNRLARARAVTLPPPLA